MAQYTLHGSNASTYVRTVRLVLEEKGLSYDSVDVNFVTEENKTEDYKTIHPYSKMPVLHDGDFRVYETIAIVNYIERANAGSKSLRPVAIKDQADMERLIHSFSSYMFSPMIGGVVWQRIVEPLKGNTSDESVVNDALPEVKRIMSLLNEELGNNTYFVNNELSLFDMFLVPAYAYLMMVEEIQAINSELPALKAWWDNMSTLESVKATA